MLGVESIMVPLINCVVNVENTQEKLCERSEDKMGLKSLIRKYKDYESQELARRATKKRKLVPYKSLKNKPKISTTKRRITKAKINTALGNPYGIKIPSAKKIIKKA